MCVCTCACVCVCVCVFRTELRVPLDAAAAVKVLRPLGVQARLARGLFADAGLVWWDGGRDARVRTVLKRREFADVVAVGDQSPRLHVRHDLEGGKGCVWFL